MQIITVYLIFLALLFVTNFKGSYGAKILAVFPMQSKSHMTVNLAVVKELANRGHDVTVVSAFPEEKPLPNYRDIVLRRYTPEDFVKLIGVKFDPFDMLEMNYLQKIFIMWNFGALLCNAVLPEEPMQNLMKSTDNFDVIFLEAFYTDCFLGFAHKFKAPIIQISSFVGTEEIGDLVGNPNPYAYVPDSFQGFNQSMNFKERVFNTLGHIIQKLARNFFIRKQDGIMRKFFNDSNMPSIEELQKSTALVLVNSHFSINYPRPLVPNFVQVGGMHVKPPKKLPAHIRI